jgi:type I restriction enzyme S subunit
MAGEWKRVTVAEVCGLIVDCVNKTAPVVDEPTPYKMLRTTNIKGGRIDREECRRVSKETFEKWTRRAEVRCGDVILTREAPLGEVGYVDFTDTVFLGQRLMQYRATPALLEPRFLLYSFLSKDLQNQFGAHEGSGSTVSHIRVGDCSKFQISLPPLVEQKRIAEVLGALDDKIELNRRMNATLEATARALFQSWFVDFDPVSAKLDGRASSGIDPTTAALFPDSFEESALGHIPKGWSAKPMPETIEVNPRRVLKAGTIAPYLDMKNLPSQGHSANEVIDREFTSGTKFQNGDTLLARITPCLENGKTGYVDFLEEGQVGWGSTEYIVFAPKPPLPPQFGYLLARSDALRSHAIQNMTGTSGRQRVPSECFNTFWLAVPPSAIAHRFDELTAPLMAKIKANSTESRTLATLRDTLLPKLLSGELSVQIE